MRSGSRHYSAGRCLDVSVPRARAARGKARPADGPRSGVIGVIVPKRLRADWRHEWESELRYRERTLAKWDLLDW
jgi:hypothetical protein